MTIPALTFAQLGAFEWLDTPMWAFDLAHRRMAWANASGLTVWGAGTLAELQARDFSDLSEGTVTRLESVMAGHALGHTSHEQWTLYPRGKPTTVRSHSASLILEDGTEAILYEGLLAPEGLDPGVLRGVEAMQRTSVVVALHDLEGRALMRNPAAIRAFGAVDADAPGDAFARLFADASLPAQVRATIAEGQVFSAELELMVGSRPVWFGMDVCRVLDPVSGTPAIQLNARDISELKAAQRALADAVAIAERASRAKSRFLATMSHEIRTPMNGMLGMAQLLMLPDVTPAERHDYAETIFSSGKTLLALLNDILDLSKIEAGKIDLDHVELTVGDVLDDVLALFADQAAARGLHLRASWEGPEGRYWGDPLRLRQMLSNLVSNAIKFSERGGITVRAVEVERTSEGALLHFSVSDQGIGIAPDNQGLLFSPFTQVDGSHTRRFAGTGLGLSIVRRLAERMGGTVGLESTEGLGSRFWFTARVEPKGETARRRPQTPAPVARVGATPSPGTAPSAAAPLILVVEDNAVNRRVAQHLLQKHGYRITCVEDGARAVEAITTQDLEPDLILMDCQMPVMDGLEATRVLRAWERAQGRPKHLPIVALTASAFHEVELECRDAGMDDFISKPVRLEETLAVLARWLPAE